MTANNLRVQADTQQLQAPALPSSLRCFLTVSEKQDRAVRLESSRGQVPSDQLDRARIALFIGLDRQASAIKAFVIGVALQSPMWHVLNADHGNFIVACRKPVL